MASKRATAIKQEEKQNELAERLAVIEHNQALIMSALGIETIPGVEEETVEPVDYSAMSVSDLVEVAMEYDIYDGIIGTGKDGNIVKADLVAALTEYDEISAE